MPRKKIIYQNWRVDQVRDTEKPPSRQKGFPDGQAEHISDRIDPADRDQSLITTVQYALDRLTPDEREFIARYHFMGETYGQIAERTGRLPHKLEALHRRAVRKLKGALGAFACERWPALKQLAAESSNGIAEPGCVLCSSPRRSEIEKLLARKQPEETWRLTLSILREEFGITIRSPQTLIGHWKYHRTVGPEE